jgi:hypothetical protein
VATETTADREFAAQVAEQAPGFSPRKARELRAREAITGGGSGGRGKATPYTDDDVIVAVEIERAKSDEAYSSKLERAILIAYARCAPVRTEGLRRAWIDEFKRPQLVASKMLDGGRLRDESWAGMAPHERNAVAGLMAHMLTGEEPSRELVRDGLAAELPDVVAAANDLIDAIVANATPDELQSVDAARLKEDREYAGLLQENTRDGWNPNRDQLAKGQHNGQLTAMPAAFRLVESFSLATQIAVAEIADREELDEARDVLRYLRHLASDVPTDIFEVSDLELAMRVPVWVVTERAHEGRPIPNKRKRRRS